MNVTEKGNLLKALQAGVVTVVFKKIGTEEIRIMPCSLNADLLNEKGVAPVVKAIDLGTEHFAAWAIDKEAWRSFRLDTVISWEEGYLSQGET